MYGYVYKAENLKSGKKYIGMRRAVNFDRLYIGEDPDFIADAEKTGREFVFCRMLMPYESEKALVAGYERFREEIKPEPEIAEAEPEARPKRRRRKAEA